MKKSFFIFILWILQGQNSFCQQIIAGPIVGAVTNHSVKFLFITDSICKGELQLSKQSDFLYVLSFSFESDETHVVNRKIEQLEPNTTYYYQVLLNNQLQEQKGSFITFPVPNETSHFSFTLGSCTEQHHDDSIFIEMQKHQPAFFLHLGDWLYTNNFKEASFYYVNSLEHQKELYQKRYEMPNLKKLLQTTPIDFVFDDEDGVKDDFSKESYTELKMKGNKTTMNEIHYPDSLLEVAIQGLHTFFPSYHEIKNQAYHSFIYGNVEIFFLDTRSTRSANTEIFLQSKRGKWKYKVPNEHVILDAAQMDWLQNKLLTSKADWKFIVSGVTFNQSYKKVFDICLRAQKKIFPNGMNGSYVAASLASMWFAFPKSQTQLLNFCYDNQIKNVVLLTGDAHTAAIDDGKNAGFPELMAGGLAQKNSKLASIIKNDLYFNLWNQGGQGIGNTNFNDAFGKVEVMGKDSIILNAIDKYGNEICSYTLKDGFIPERYKLKVSTKINRMKALRNLLRIAIKK